MSKILMILGFALFGSSVFAQNFKVTETIKSRPVVVEDVEVKFVGSKVAKDDSGKVSPLGSTITFLITGKYEGGWCWFDKLGAQLKTSSNPADSKDVVEISLHGIETAQENLELGEKVCGGGSMGRFELPVEIGISMWGSDDKEKTYTYTIEQNARSPQKSYLQLTATFNISKGWTYDIR